MKVIKDVLPGFNLECNEKTFTLQATTDFSISVNVDGPLLIDPLKYADEDDIALEIEWPAEAENYAEAAKKLHKALQKNGSIAPTLWKACVDAGFSPLCHGPLEYWLLNHLAVNAASHSLE